jgi:hypothetical protein
MNPTVVVFAVLAVVVFAASFWVGGVFAAMIAFALAGVAIWKWIVGRTAASS